jgi:hypothetical protein
MGIKMKIVEVHPNEHSVVVRYFSDAITEEMLAMSGDRRSDGTPVRCRTDANLNIREVPAPTGQALIDYIFKFSPPNREWFDLQEKIVNPAVDTSMPGVVATTTPVVVPPIVVSGPPNVIPVRRRRTPLTSIPQTEF